MNRKTHYYRSFSSFLSDLTRYELAKRVQDVYVTPDHWVIVLKAVSK